MAILSSPWTGPASQGIGSIVEGFAGGRAADFQAQIARNNAQVALANSQAASQAGDIAAMNSLLRTRAQIGQTKVAQAASGIDVNTGSAADVRASQRLLGVLDAMTIRSNAARASYGYQAESMSEAARAKSLARRAGMSRIRGIMDASGTILEGATTIDRQRRIWQDTIGSLDDEQTSDVDQYKGQVGDFDVRFA